MKVKDVLESLVSGTAVELVEFGDILKRGTAFSLWNSLPDWCKEADVDMITVRDDIVKLFIKKPITTIFDKLKEIFPDIEWVIQVPQENLQQSKVLMMKLHLEFLG